MGGLAESAARAAPGVEHGAAALNRLGTAARTVAPTLDQIAENAAARLAALRLSTMQAAEQEATQASIDSMIKVIRGWAAADQVAAEASRRTLMHYATMQRGAAQAAEQIAAAAKRQVGVATETAARVAAEAEKAGVASGRVALSLDSLSGARQHGHRLRVLARAAVSFRRMVAMEFDTWRSGRSGGRAGSSTGGNSSLRELAGGAPS